MIYDEFKQVLIVTILDPNEHIAIVLNNPPCDQDTVLDYLYDNAENIKTSYYRYYNHRVYLVLNKDIILKDTLVDYETVTDLPEIVLDPQLDNESQLSGDNI